MLEFGRALSYMKNGGRMTRLSWGGAFVCYMDSMRIPAYNSQSEGKKVNDRTAKMIGKDTPLVSLGYFAHYSLDKKWQPGWVPTTEDLLADDWMIFDQGL